MRLIHWFFTALALASAAGMAWADDADLRRRIDELEQRLSQFESNKDAQWLARRQGEEFESIVRDVLEDTERRSSFAGGEARAGHDGKNFFLTDPTGNFLMKIVGRLQFRWIGNHQSGRADEDDAGFQLRRAILGVEGNLMTPQLKYKLKFETSRATGSNSIEDAYLTYNFPWNSDTWWEKDATIKAGYAKIPFLREELTSSGKQLALARGVVTEFFTLDRSELLELNFKGEQVVPHTWRIAITDGADEGFSDSHQDPAEIALATRVDMKLAGDWKQLKDYEAWSNEEFAAFVGIALFWQVGDARNHAVTNSSSPGNADYLAWTVDGSIESKGLNLSAAITGADIDFDAPGVKNRDMLGVSLQGGYFVIPDVLEPFARFECLDDGVSGTDDAYLLTLGTNYFVAKHNAKITADVVWFFDGDIPAANPFGNTAFTSGLGLAEAVSSSVGDLVVLRIQWQQQF